MKAIGDSISAAVDGAEAFVGIHSFVRIIIIRGRID